MIVVLLTASCASKRNTLIPTMPVWMVELPPVDNIWGVGIALLQDSNLGLQLATNRAQTEAARQINALVHSELINHANEEGLADDPRSITAIENIERNLIDSRISSYRIDKRDRMQDGTWYVRISIRKSDAIGHINSIVENELAEYSEFMTDLALSRINASLYDTRMRPSPLGDE